MTERRIRVLEIMEPIEGGTLRHLWHIIRLLDRERFSLSIAVSPLRNEEAPAEIERMRQHVDELHVVPMVRAISPSQDLAAFRSLRKLIAAGKYDVVHTHSSKAGFLGRRACRGLRVPRVVHTPHVFPFTQDVGAFRARLYRKLESMAARWCDDLVVLTQYQKKLALEIGCRPEMLHVIHNGLLADEFPPGADRSTARSELDLPYDAVVIAAAGRFYQQKGFDVLLRAARKVVDSTESAVFILAGDGPLRPDLERLHAELSLGDRFRLIGRRSDMAAAYAAADVVAMPSLWEGMPYVLLEAMHFGKAIVASDVCGVGEIVVDGRDALLVEPRSADALAEAILRVVTDAALRERLSRTAGEHSSEFDARSSIRQLEQVYETPRPAPR